MKITDILALTASPATTTAALESALDAIDAERAATHATLDNAQAKRRELLTQDGTDTQIIGLDVDSDRLNLKLERLDAAEHAICAQFRVFEDARKEARFSELIADYRSALGEFLPAMQAAIEAFKGLQKVRGVVETEGFHQRMRQFALPPSPFPFDGAGLDAFVAGARDALGLPRGLVEATPVFPVAFTVTANGHSVGDVAAFPASEAWALVKGGFASWADRRNVPAPEATA